MNIELDTDGLTKTEAMLAMAVIALSDGIRTQEQVDQFKKTIIKAKEAE